MFSYRFNGNKYKTLDKFLPRIANTVRYQKGVTRLEILRDGEKFSEVDLYIDENNEISMFPVRDLLLQMIRAEDQLQNDPRFA